MGETCKLKADTCGSNYFNVLLLILKQASPYKYLCICPGPIARPVLFMSREVATAYLN